MHESCHHCNYDLTGLSAKGTCPECGEYYDKHSSYRMVRSEESAVSRHAKWVFLAACTAVILILGAAIAAISKQWTVLILTFLLAGLSGFGAYAYWSADRQAHKAAD